MGLIECASCQRKVDVNRSECPTCHHPLSVQDKNRNYARITNYIGAGSVLALFALLGGLWLMKQAETANEVAKAPARYQQDQRLGKPEVYQQLETSTDCAELKASFERNKADYERRHANEPGSYLESVVYSYMKTAEKRMGELGCQP